MQARFYAPWFGRFLSPDPARDQHFEQTQSWNIYSYVMNSPTMGTDPTGMVPEWLKALGGYASGVTHDVVQAVKGVGQSFSSPKAYVKAMAASMDPVGTVIRNRGAIAAEAKADANTLVNSTNTFDVAKVVGKLTFRILAAVELGSAMAPGKAPTAPAAPALDAAGNPAGAPGTIFRGGGTNPGNLTMRAGEDALSFRDSLSNPYPLAEGTQPVLRPGQPYFGVDAGKLPAGSAVPDGAAGSPVTPPGHVSVQASADALKAAVVEKGKFPN